MGDKYENLMQKKKTQILAIFVIPFKLYVMKKKQISLKFATSSKF